jgi:hypothetical protein
VSSSSEQNTPRSRQRRCNSATTAVDENLQIKALERSALVLPAR